VMTPNPRTILADAALLTAIRTMADHRIKRLPVVDAQGCLVGLLSRADVLRTVAAGGEGVLGGEGEPPPQAPALGDVRMTAVPAVRPETSIDDVVHLTLSSPSRRVVVTTPDGIVQGIITDRRLLARSAADIQPRFLQALGDLIDAVAHWRSARKPL